MLTEKAGTTGWYLYDSQSKQIVEDPERIIDEHPVDARHPTALSPLHEER